MAERVREGINLRAVITVALTIVAVIAVVGLATDLLWKKHMPPDARNAPNAPLDFRVAPPVLDSAPQPQRVTYFAEKNRDLNGWGWVDRRAGIAHIPIAQAMQLMAAQEKTAPDKRSAHDGGGRP